MSVGGGKFCASGATDCAAMSMTAGVLVQVGAIFSWRRFAVSAGVSTISFKTAAFTCGIGVRL